MGSNNKAQVPMHTYLRSVLFALYFSNERMQTNKERNKKNEKGKEERQEK